MARNTEAKIVEALFGWFGGISLPAGVRVAYPNVNFEPDPRLPHVSLAVRKNNPTTADLSGGEEPIRMGLLAADVYWPAGEGIVRASELAGDIRDRYAFDTRIPHEGILVWIVEEPAVLGDVQGDVYVHIPVIVPWHVYPRRV